jgi:DNA-binding CsgD family transcriptional regulator
MLVLFALPRLGFTQFTTGRWTDLRQTAEHALSLSATASKRPLAAVALGLLTLLEAAQGRPVNEVDELLGRLEEAARQPLGVLADPVHDLGRWARGTFAMHDGDAQTALHHLGQMRRGTVRRLAALFESALTHHAKNSPGWAHPYEQARTAWPTGSGRGGPSNGVEARAPAGRAGDVRGPACRPRRPRAAQELRASGETARKRDVSTALHLTPPERQVAELVRQGLSNKDVAAQCWVSHRTVAFHLRNVFATTGVAARGELARLDLS